MKYEVKLFLSAISNSYLADMRSRHSAVAVTLQDQVSAEIAVTLELTRAIAPKAKGASRNY